MLPTTIDCWHALIILESIYQRRGARRWKKIRRINGHAFAPKRFAVSFMCTWLTSCYHGVLPQSAYCAICEDRIWGLGRQVCSIYVYK